MSYQEIVYRFRVLKCLNDELRNPEKEWDLVFSSNSRDQAEAVMAEEIEGDKKYNFNDLYQIVDNSKETVIDREIW
jgi:hypothetical protein